MWVQMEGLVQAVVQAVGQMKEGSESFWVADWDSVGQLEGLSPVALLQFVAWKTELVTSAEVNLR